MSKKKKPGSALPSDPFTFTTGNNYGLDGFYHEMDYNEGVLDSARLPEVKGLSSLPEGLVPPDGQEASAPKYVEKSAEENFELEEMLREAHTRLPNLDWLDLETEHEKQDPARLPEMPDSIPELVEAWGVHRRTDGLHILPNNMDKTALDYHLASEDDEVELEEISPVDLRRIVGRAIRRSEAGDNFNDIATEVRIALEGKKAKLEPILNALAEDYGLAGNVFIRASAYEGCHNGRWTKHVKKNASEARYVQKAVKCDDCAFNQNKRCAVFKKRLVDNIPWKSARKHYEPKLVAAGYKVASGSSKTALRQAFLNGPEYEVSETAFHKQPHPADSVQYGEAQEKLAKADRTRQVFEKQTNTLEKKRERVARMLDKWQQESLLSKHEASRLKASLADPDKVLDSAVQLVALSNIKKASYVGSGVDAIKPVDVSRDEIWGELKTAERNKVKEQFALTAHVRDKVSAQLDSLVNRNLLSQKEAGQLIALGKNPEQTVRLAYALIDKRDFAPVRKAKEEAAKIYDGDGVGAIPDIDIDTRTAWDSVKSAEDKSAKLRAVFDLRDRQTLVKSLEGLVKSGLLLKKEAGKLLNLNKKAKETMKLASAIVAQRQADTAVIPENTGEKSLYSGKVGDRALPTYDKGLSLKDAKKTLKNASYDHWVSDREVQALLKWAAQKLNEGMAGNDFDQLLTLRFSEPVRKKAASEILNLREQHEGLAGHLYVDAAVYASETGVTGCEKGGLQHRANGVPFVVEIDRCASCVFKNADGFCQKYNKQLISEMPIDNPQEYQADMIRQANASDHEATASLFAGTGAELIDEFGGLKNANLDNFDFTDDTPVEDLGEVLWGGSYYGEE